MNSLIIERNVRTPYISAEPTGLVKIEGISIPENSIEFYEPLKVWLDQYFKNPCDKTILNVKLDYFNTSTANILLNLFKQFSKSVPTGKFVEINWFYEKGDFEMEESGNDYKSLLSIPFNIVEFA